MSARLKPLATPDEERTPEDGSRLGEIIAEIPIALGYLVAYVANHYLGPVYKQVEGEHDLTSPEFLALMCIVQVPGINAIDIARSSGRPRNSISRAVSLLLEKALITIEPDAVDRRRKRLVATALGAQLYRRVAAMFEARHREMLSVLDPAETAQLEHLLRKLAFRTDGWAKPY